jgi:hypothetical protein
MEARERHGVEGEPRRECRHGSDAMATGTRALGVASRAEIAGARRAHAVLTDPVAVVDEMAARQASFRLQIDVAAVTVSEVPLILVLVAAEAGRHLGAKLRRLLLRDPDVAPDAVALHVGHVGSVLEAQVLPRKLCTFAHEGLAVTAAARIFVVRLRVAAAADGFAGKVDGPRVARERDPFVARDAIDPLDHVRAVLERMRLRRPPKPQHPGARGEREGEEQEQPSREQHGQATLHRNSRVFARRMSAFVS